MSIWVTSDLHFNHKNIINLGRKFNSVEEHNEYIISQFNSVVEKDDLVYILGDLGFTPATELSKLVPRLNGRKVLIYGNHDKLKIGEYRSMGFIEVYDKPFYYNRACILSHYPVKEAFDNPYVYNLHGHLHFSKLTLPNFMNVNCELNDYKPYNLKEIGEQCLRQAKTRREKFKEEWYAEYEKSLR